MSRIWRAITNHPAWVLAGVLVLTIVALDGIVDLRTGELRLTVDPSIDRLLPDEDEGRTFYEKAREAFGTDEFVLLVIDAADVFEPSVLERLQRITNRIEKVGDVQRVISLANARQAEDRNGDLYIGPFYEEPPRDPVAAAALRQKVFAHPIYGGTLVAKNGRATAILVFFEKGSMADFVKRGLSDEIASIAREESGGLPVVVTGMPHIKSRLSSTIVKELRFILPAVMLISAALCAIAFRTVRGVALPLAGIGIALIWTMGAIGWSGSPLTLVTNIVPPLVITLGFAAAIHMVSEYYEMLQHMSATDRPSNRAVVERVLQEMGLAITVNGLTTVLGFLSLCVTSVNAIREFGIWSTVGVVASTVVSLTFIPAMIVLLGPSRRAPPAQVEGRVDRIAERLASSAVQYRRWIFAGSLILLAATIFGMVRIRVSTGFASNFIRGSEVRSVFETVNDQLGGVSSFFLVVDGGQDDAFTQPENLEVLRELQEWLKAQPEIGGATSIADGVMLLNRAFLGGEETALTIPTSARVVKQLLSFGGKDLTRGFADSKYRTANVVVRSRVSESGDVKKLMERLDRRLAELPQRLRARPTGDLVLLSSSMDAIVLSDLQSIGTAMFTIYLALAFLLTSFRVGLLALLPNLLPIAIYYGALGLTGTPLNLSTSLIAAITLGIAVDDTVHYFARFSLEARRLGDERRATATTLRSVIRPITFTMLGLCLGFLTLTMSELQNQVQFGLLSAFTIFVGWLLELTLSPAICSQLRLVTIWDLLSIDIGPQPQRSIPLFGGLSERQARVFALMSQIVSFPAGQRVFTEGERGDQMLVVIDGELSASLMRGTERVEYSRMRRGDTVGEIALFSERRSADVDVVKQARVLRFGEADLARLGKRYPRIAAKVNANLNRILANRVMSTTRALR